MRWVATACLLFSTLVAACATRPRPETEWRLIGSAPSEWGGRLTARSLAIDIPDRPHLDLVSQGFPCPAPEVVCFFGSPNRPPYVNATTDTFRLSLVIDPKPCGITGQRKRYPYTVVVYGSDLGSGEKVTLKGCAEPGFARRR